MRSQRRLGVWAVAVTMLAACTGSAPASETAPESSEPVPTTTIPMPEFVPPSVSVADPGVATRARVGDHSETIEDMAEGLVESGRGGDIAVDLAFDACRLVGPGQWLMEGTVTVPDEEPVTVILDFMSRETDMIYGIPVLVAFDGSGRFAFLADFLTRDVSPDAIYWPTGSFRPDDGWCNLELRYASLPTRAVSLTATAEVSDEPLWWTAPADSVQGLGVGAVMSDPGDPRVSWAAMALAGIHPGLGTVWIADPLPRLESYSVSDGCEMLSTHDDTWIRLMRRCPGPLDEWPEAPDLDQLPEVEGFEPVSWDGISALMTHRDGWTILIASAEVAVEPDAIERAARSLRPIRNLVVVERTQPGVDADLDRAIASRLATDEAAERARLQLSDTIHAVVAIGPRMALKEYLVERREDVWVAQGGHAEGYGSMCVGAGGDLGVSVLVTPETDWTIQLLTEEGWESTPTSNGVAWFRDGFPMFNHRAVDGEGRPVACSWPVLDEGEEWSPWMLPGGQWDLPLTAEPDTGLTDGSVMTVTGSDFPARANLELAQCLVADVLRPDIVACQPIDESGSRLAQTDDDGNFVIELVLTDQFETEFGEEIDCRQDPCYIVARSFTALPRSGMTPITFGS